jgi:uncharacterized glyoxalase superfamily protein PhnB
MAGGKKGGKDKKDKKDRKAERKARKAAKKAARKAEKFARKQAREQANRPARRTPKTPSSRPVARRPANAPVRKAAKRVAPRKPAVSARPERLQPESLRLRSASPSFTVNDLETSLAFYRDLLRFTVKERWEEDGVLRGVELVAGRVTLWISQDDWKKGRDRAKGLGFRVYCTTAQDVDALAEGIKARGGTLAEEPQDRPWGGREFAVVDPDGFAITIAREG